HKSVLNVNVTVGKQCVEKDLLHRQVQVREPSHDIVIGGGEACLIQREIKVSWGNGQHSMEMVHSLEIGNMMYKGYSCQDLGQSTLQIVFGKEVRHSSNFTSYIVQPRLHFMVVSKY